MPKTRYLAAFAVLVQRAKGRAAHLDVSPDMDERASQPQTPAPISLTNRRRAADWLPDEHRLPIAPPEAQRQQTDPSNLDEWQKRWLMLLL
jgi:hypothetical protein